MRAIAWLRRHLSDEERFATGGYAGTPTMEGVSGLLYPGSSVRTPGEAAALLAAYDDEDE